MNKWSFQLRIQYIWLQLLILENVVLKIQVEDDKLGEPANKDWL